MTFRLVCCLNYILMRNDFLEPMQPFPAALYVKLWDKTLKCETSYILFRPSIVLIRENHEESAWKNIADCYYRRVKNQVLYGTSVEQTAEVTVCLWQHTSQRMAQTVDLEGDRTWQHLGQVVSISKLTTNTDEWI